MPTEEVSPSRRAARPDRAEVLQVRVGGVIAGQVHERPRERHLAGVGGCAGARPAGRPRPGGPRTAGARRSASWTAALSRSCACDVVLDAGEAVHLEQEEGEDQRQHDTRPPSSTIDGQPARPLSLEDLRGKQVDLAHGSLPGIASPTATASTGSASAVAASESASCDGTRWNTCPGPTGTGMRWRIRSSRPSSLDRRR